jgi:hypothetical protein
LASVTFPIFVTVEWSIFAGSLEKKKFAGGMKQLPGIRIATH